MVQNRSRLNPAWTHSGLAVLLQAIPAQICFRHLFHRSFMWILQQGGYTGAQCYLRIASGSSPATTRCHFCIDQGSECCSMLCPAGTEFTERGFCERCQVGFYQNHSGTTSPCQQCDAGRTTAREGATSCDVVLCASGCHDGEPCADARCCARSFWNSTVARNVRLDGLPR